MTETKIKAIDFFRQNTGISDQVRLSFNTHFMNKCLSKEVYCYVADRLTKKVNGPNPPRYYTVSMLRQLSESIYGSSS